MTSKRTSGAALTRQLATAGRSRAKTLRWEAASERNEARALLALFRSPRARETRAARRARVSEVCRQLRAKLRAWHTRERQQLAAELRAKHAAERAALASRCRAARARLAAVLQRPRDRARALRAQAAQHQAAARSLSQAHASELRQAHGRRMREKYDDAIATARASIEFAHPELLGVFDEWAAGRAGRGAYRTAREQLARRGKAGDRAAARHAKSARGVGEEMAIAFVEAMESDQSALAEWEQRQLGTDAEHEAAYLASEARARGVSVADLLRAPAAPKRTPRPRRARSSHVAGVPF